MFPVQITIHNAADLTAVMAALGRAPKSAVMAALGQAPKSAAQSTVALAAASVSAGEKQAVTAITPQSEDKPAKKPTPAQPKMDKPASTPPTAEVVEAAAPASDAQAPAVDYPTLQKKVFELAALHTKRGEPGSKATEISKALGANTFKDLPASEYAEALAKVEARIAELTAEGEVA